MESDIVPLLPLLQRYAICARELADAVARLGHHTHVSPEFLKLMEEIKDRQASCIYTGEELKRYLEHGLSTSANPTKSEQELAKDRYKAARERYKQADEELRYLSAQARDRGLNQPDDTTAVQIATMKLNRALDEYHSALRTMSDFLLKDPNRTSVK
jgi:hypothetical protein